VSGAKVAKNHDCHARKKAPKLIQRKERRLQNMFFCGCADAGLSSLP